jgi:hypothetical protein
MSRSVALVEEASALGGKEAASRFKQVGELLDILLKPLGARRLEEPSLRSRVAVPGYGATRSCWLSIDSLGRRPRRLPGVLRILLNPAKDRRTARDDVTTDFHVEQGSVDLVVVGVAVGRLVVEDHDQVKVAVWAGATLSSAAKEVDAHWVQSRDQALDNGSKSLLFRIEAAVVGGRRPHDSSLAGAQCSSSSDRPRGLVEQILDPTVQHRPAPPSTTYHRDRASLYVLPASRRKRWNRALSGGAVSASFRLLMQSQWVVDGLDMSQSPEGSTADFRGVER